MLSDERMGLSFTIAAGPRQHSHSQIRVSTFYYLRFETPPTWRAGFSYLYHPGRGWPRYTPRHWVPFSSHPTTRRVTVKVLEPTSIWESASVLFSHFLLIILWTIDPLLGRDLQTDEYSRCYTIGE
jgi:hypothetical protein